LQAVELPLERGDARVDLVELAVVRGKPGELGEVTRLARQALIALEAAAQAGVLG
jgi:hypothetical protein